LTTFNYVTIGFFIVNAFLLLVIIPMRGSIKDVEKDVKELRSTVQTEYMSKSDFKDHLERIEKSLDEVKAMLINNKNSGR
jgi:hypothetical protein